MVLRASKHYVEILAAGDGLARVSQHYVEILAAGDGLARVSQQYVEILAHIRVINKAATDAISFVETDIVLAEYARVIPESLTITETLETQHYIVSDALVFTEVAEIIFEAKDTLTFVEVDQLVPLYRQFEDTLTFVEDVVVWHSNLEVDEAIVFAEDAIGHIAVTYEESLTDNLVFTDVSSYVINRYTQTVTDSLTLLETADNSSIGRTLSDIITFTEVIAVDETVKTQALLDSCLIYEEITVGGTQSFTITDNLTNDIPRFDTDTGDYYTEHLGLQEILNYDLISPRVVYEGIYFTETISKVHVKRTGSPYWLVDTIVFTDEANQPTESASDTFIFVDTATYQKDRPQLEAIIFVEAIIVNKVMIPVVIDTLTIIENVSYELFKSDTLCIYSPFVGTTTDTTAPAPPSVTPITIVQRDTVEFTYNTTVLTIRCPEFGNRDKLQYQRINRESRGGTLIVFADPIWPQQQTMLLDFYALSEAEAQSILDFIIESLGKQFRFCDWESQTWICVSTSSDNVLIRNGKSGCSVSLEIIVRSLPEEIVTDTLVFISTTSYPVLDWKTFTGAEWNTFGTFEWEQFVGE